MSKSWLPTALGSLINWLALCLFHCQMFTCLAACLDHWLSDCRPAKHLPNWQPAQLPAYQATGLPRCLLTKMPACLPANLPNCLPAWLSIDLPNCLPAFLPACLPAFLPAYPRCRPASSFDRSSWWLREVSKYEVEVLTTQPRSSVQLSHLLLILYLYCLIFLQKDDDGFLAVSCFVTYTWQK
jgi:hypothetical protein